MEQYLAAHSDKFDHGVMDRFLNLSELPVIGSSALEQILHQASLDYPSSSAPLTSSSSAMSPDSSQWTASTSGVESGSESSDIDCLPGEIQRKTVDVAKYNVC